jgi:hypothetical protein
MLVDPPDEPQRKVHNLFAERGRVEQEAPLPTR